MFIKSKNGTFTSGKLLKKLDAPWEIAEGIPSTNAMEPAVIAAILRDHFFSSIM